jgi:hypothetical protein
VHDSVKDAEATEGIAAAEGIAATGRCSRVIAGKCRLQLPWRRQIGDPRLGQASRTIRSVRSHQADDVVGVCEEPSRDRGTDSPRDTAHEISGHVANVTGLPSGAGAARSLEEFVNSSVAIQRVEAACRI